MPEITSLYAPDMVAFLLGCSFTFEKAMIDAGLPVRHVEEGKNVPMYTTDIACRPAGIFRGPLVVSMRPIPADSVNLAADVTARFPKVHGAPVHAGDPRSIGIADLAQPDFGDAVTIHPGEVPVFWACGVTSQVAVQMAVMQSGLETAISHSPGHMLVTDLRESEL